MAQVAYQESRADGDQADKTVAAETTSQLQSHLLKIPTPSSNEFEYDTLSSADNEIRILSLSTPAFLDGLVSCTLHHVSLNNPPQYAALSYTWKDRHHNADLKKSILIDGHTVAVTANLEAALRQLLATGTVASVWADAVCINQRCVHERNDQVSKMKDIYAKATTTVTWLGESYEQSDLAFEILHRLLAAGSAKALLNPSLEPWTADMVPPPDIITALNAVRLLFLRTYWTRVWVIQELSFDSQVVVHCGKFSIEWNDLQQCVALLFKDAVFLSDALLSVPLGRNYEVFWQEGPGAQDVGNVVLPEDFTARHDLATLLNRHYHKEATDPRDMVFGILSLADEQTRRNVPVSYELNVSQVFINAARFIIEEHSDLSILTQNKGTGCFSANVDENFGLPTWVPNWAGKVKSRVDNMCSTFGEHPTTYARSGGNTKPECWVEDKDKTLDSGDEVLHVRGIPIGTVFRVGDVGPFVPEGKADVTVVFQILYQWWLVFLSTGRTNLSGLGGFFDVIVYGNLYQNGTDPHYIALMVEAIMSNVAIAMSVHVPEAEGEEMKKLIETVDRKTLTEGDITRAETDCYGVEMGARNRAFIVIDGVECGIGPRCVEAGDQVVVFLGCKVPVVLRPRKDGQGYLLIGDAFVDGFMLGRAVEEMDLGKRKSEMFELY